MRISKRYEQNCFKVTDKFGLLRLVGSNGFVNDGLTIGKDEGIGYNSTKSHLNFHLK
jgi:hypothetical protein